MTYYDMTSRLKAVATIDSKYPDTVKQSIIDAIIMMYMQEDYTTAEDCISIFEDFIACGAVDFASLKRRGIIAA